MPKRKTDPSAAIDMIDGALRDCAVSDDAMRWTPEEEEPENPEHVTTVDNADGQFNEELQEMLREAWRALQDQAEQMHQWHVHVSLGRVDPLGLRQPQVDRRVAGSFWVPVVGGDMHRSIVNLPHDRATQPRTFPLRRGHAWSLTQDTYLYTVTYFPHWVNGSWAGERWRTRVLAQSPGRNERELQEAIINAFEHGWHPIDALTSEEIEEVRRENFASGRFLVVPPRYRQIPR